MYYLKYKFLDKNKYKVLEKQVLLFSNFVIN